MILFFFWNKKNVERKVDDIEKTKVSVNGHATRNNIVQSRLLTKCSLTREWSFDVISSFIWLISGVHERERRVARERSWKRRQYLFFQQTARRQPHASNKKKKRGNWKKKNLPWFILRNNIFILKKIFSRKVDDIKKTEVSKVASNEKIISSKIG